MNSSACSRANVFSQNCTIAPCPSTHRGRAAAACRGRRRGRANGRAASAAARRDPNNTLHTPNKHNKSLSHAGLSIERTGPSEQSSRPMPSAGRVCGVSSRLTCTLKGVVSLEPLAGLTMGSTRSGARVDSDVDERAYEHLSRRAALTSRRGPARSGSCAAKDGRGGGGAERSGAGPRAAAALRAR